MVMLPDGGDDNSEGDDTFSCFKSDSGNSDNSEADADDDGYECCFLICCQVQQSADCG